MLPLQMFYQYCIELVSGTLFHSEGKKGKMAPYLIRAQRALPKTKDSLGQKNVLPGK